MSSEDAKFRPAIPVLHEAISDWPDGLLHYLFISTGPSALLDGEHNITAHRDFTVAYSIFAPMSHLYVT